MGLNHPCFAFPAIPTRDHAEHNIRILNDAVRRLNMDPLEQIRKTIAHLEDEAKWARDNADHARTKAEAEEQAAIEHEERAEQWRRILAREERAATDERTVTVKLEADVSGFIAEMERVDAALRQADGSLTFAAGGITRRGIHRFAEPESLWEAYISGRTPEQRQLDREIWEETGRLLGYIQDDEGAASDD